MGMCFEDCECLDSATITRICSMPKWGGRRPAVIHSQGGTGGSPGDRIEPVNPTQREDDHFL